MVNTFPRAAGLDLRCANRHCCWCCFTLERKHRTERKKIMPLFGVYACLLNVKFFLTLAKAKSFYISLISLRILNTRFWRPHESGAWGHVHPAAPLSLRLCLDKFFELLNLHIYYISNEKQRHIYTAHMKSWVFAPFPSEKILAMAINIHNVILKIMLRRKFHKLTENRNLFKLYYFAT